MPANLVRPGTEKYWTRAKERAAEQGRAEDWPYVVGIYKRMTVNKSEGKDSEGEYWIKAASGLVGPFRGPQDPKIPPKLLGLPVVHKPPAERLEKGAMGGPNAVRYFINVRQGGQVPSRERLRELAQAYRPPQPATTARLLDSGKPVYRLSDVFSGLGLDPDAQASWQAMLGPVIEGSGNEVALRQAIYSVMRERKADGALGSAVLERALKYRANRLQKSLEAPNPNCFCQLVTVDELRKSAGRWDDADELAKSYRAIKTAYEKEYGKGAWGKIKVPEDVQESKAKAEKLPFGSKTRLGPEEKHRYTEAKRRLAGKLGMPKTGWGLYGRSIVGALKQREQDRAEKSEALSKAEPRGGTYYRRVMTKGGRYRYYYDQGKYESSPEAHLDGEGASKRAIKARVGALLEKAGKAGVAVAELKTLTKRYGAKRVAGVLKSAQESGELTYKKGKLRAQARKEPKQ